MSKRPSLLDVAIQYHEALPRRLRAYLNNRGIGNEIINSHLLGWNGWRITIPIYNRQGEVTFFKLAKDPEDRRTAHKILTSRNGGVELYGWEHLREGRSSIVICEGEFDRLVLETHGFPAVTSTAGAGCFRPEWAAELRKIENVYVCYDRDQAGRNGAALVAMLIPKAKICELPPEVGEGGDITDFFVRLKKRNEEFMVLLQQAKPLSSPPTLTRPQTHSNSFPPIAALTKRIDQIKHSISIQEVVARYVPLQPLARAGTLAGRCPFHNDKTPSLVVYADSGTYHCFGCRANGDAISFLRAMEHLGFTEAIEELEQMISSNDTSKDQQHNKAA